MRFSNPLWHVPRRPRGSRRRFSPASPLSALGIAAIAASGPAHADSLPLWEAGAGVSALSLPDYRGSDHQSTYVLPFPYVIYRGDIFKVDREGMRAKFFESDRIQFDVSGGGSVPVSSSSDRARNGMPDLRPTLEIGPVVQYRAWRAADGASHVDVRLPVRRALTYENGRIVDVGTVAAIQFAWDRSLRFDSGSGNLGVLAGPLFGDRRQHDYFYAVAPGYATASRPAYAARGGYAGSQATAAFSRRAGRLWFGAYVRYDDLHGAVFEDSPLVVRHSAVAGGLGIAWVFGASSRLVEAAP